MISFEERSELRKSLIELKEDIFANYPKNLELIDSFLKMSPNDQEVIWIKIIILVENKKYDLAIFELKNYLNKFIDDQKAIKKLFLIYYYTRRYQEAYDMILDVYKAECFSPIGTRIMEIFIEHKLGLSINLDVEEFYKLKQLKNYNEEEAIKHISEHKYIEDFDENAEIMFNKRIDLEKLFKITRENLKNAERSSKLDSCDIYYFALHNVGLDSDNIYNYFKVVAIPETNNIITMYPCNEETSKEINTLNMMGINIYKEEMIKSSSQIDKFNRKYNR